MKMIQYFDVRFLRGAEEDHRRANKAGYYVKSFASDICHCFHRKISLPCLPQRGQIYHLNFNPATDTSHTDGVHTGCHIQQSGFVEKDDDFPVPYFIISDDTFFTRWLTESPVYFLNDTAINRAWKEKIESRMAVLIPSFQKHGWEYLSGH